MGIGILCHLNDFLSSNVNVCRNHGSKTHELHPIELKVIAL
jgi:hypothetical protein